MNVSMSAGPGTPELSSVVAGGEGDEPETLAADTQESGFSHLMNKELYPVRKKVVGK